MKKLFKIAEVKGKKFLLPDVTAEGFTEAYGAKAHVDHFGLKAFPAVNLAKKMTDAEKKAGLPEVTDDPKRILPYFCDAAVALVGGTPYSDKMKSTLLENFIPAVIERALEQVVTFIQTIAVDASGQMSAEALDKNLSDYLGTIEETKRAGVVADVYFDTVAIAEDATNVEAFTRLAEVFKFDLQPDTIDATTENPTDAVPMDDDLEPVTTEEPGVQTPAIVSEAVTRMTRTAHILHHLSKTMQLLASDVEETVLRVSTETGVQIPVLEAIPVGLPEVAEAAGATVAE